MRYNLQAPYNILSTRDIDFETLQRINRFVRYWDMIANTGRFRTSLALDYARRHPRAGQDGFQRLLQTGREDASSRQSRTDRRQRQMLS